METIEYWIQLENRPWDLSPHDKDRMTGKHMDDKQLTGKPSALVTLTSVVPGVPPRSVTMFNPLRDSTGNVIDALILRRYKKPTQPDQSDAWTVPDDRKVNPWDLNEHNPGDDGTMGTIPGPVIECSVGDEVVVHFKNLDFRVGKTGSLLKTEARTHSLHPHGFGFRTFSDGAYPLTPPDLTQPVAGEAGWAGSFKQGDRVPPGATFTYTWGTFGWPSTAGVWLYHDHSICDHENVELGAIGLIVIHNNVDVDNEVDIRLNPTDPDDPTVYDPAFLPAGSPNGSPTRPLCIPFPDPKPPVHSTLLGQLGLPPDHLHGPGHGHEEGLESALSLRVGSAVLQLSDDLRFIEEFCNPVYRTPPDKMLILQLYHTLKGQGMCINGRKYLGNTPTVVSGRSTKMRFGVVGMGSDTHTFHLHGHRWIIPGPDGNDPVSIQNSPQNSPVSQFEDTRLLGPANSLAFTIVGASGSFMRAGGPSEDAALGEWHMHCHVLSHMMEGMMGSLLIVKGGELVSLPEGSSVKDEPACPPADTGGPPMPNEVHLIDSKFVSPNIMINAGDTVTWRWDTTTEHSVTSDDGTTFDSGPKTGGVFPFTFPTAGTFPYHCNFHSGMTGTVMVM